MHQRPSTGSPRDARKSAGAFYRSSILWLAFGLFAASLAGCIVTIVLALGHPDGALPDVGERLLSVPTSYPEDR